MARRSSVVSELAGHEKPEIKRGGSILQQNEHFVENRRCRDVVWGLLFWLLATGVVVGAIWSALLVYSVQAADSKQKHVLDLTSNSFSFGLLSVLAAGVAATGFSLLFLQFAKRNGECVIWTALLLGPFCMMLCGGALMTQGWPMPGLVGLALFCMGICLTSCVVCCYRDLVPFTALVLKTVIRVVELHPSMMILTMVSGLLQLVWQMACVACVLGASLYSQEVFEMVKSRASSSPQKAVFVVVWAFVYGWGSLVVVNAAFTACAGVYGRWYFEKDSGTPVATSWRVAWTTSFGSICYGSFVVAAVRAVQFLVKTLASEARSDGDYVLYIILKIVECFIDCIGDILEWVSEMAYVQCAVRGVGFCEACSATFAVCSYSSIDGIVATLLIDCVPGLGAIVVGMMSGSVGFVVYHSCLSLQSWSMSIFGFCFFVGALVAYAALMPLKSGAMTIIVCYAEDRSFLQRKDPELYEAFGNAHVDDDDSSVSSAPAAPAYGAMGQARDVRAAPLMEMQNVQR